MLVQILLLASFLALYRLVGAFKFNQPRLINHNRNRLASTDLTTVHVGLQQSKSYPIYIGNKLLGKDLLSRLVDSKKALVVTNTIVAPIYLDKVMHALRSKGIDVVQITLPDGEVHKNMDTLMSILDAAMQARLDRKSVMVALGGGVVGDMCGFAASIYQRGIRCVMLLTVICAFLLYVPLCLEYVYPLTGVSI